MEKVNHKLAAIKFEMAKVIIGQEEILEKMLIALIVGGHVLLEGPPGVAKTLLAKVFARVLSAKYKRVQFTPDLMPLDLTGTNIFDFQKQQFLFQPGPVFTDILLADEINRTPPKTQAALLEAMEEKQVTIDGASHSLSEIFTVIATQNPIEFEGTYPLPEAQVDRFLFQLNITYPNAEEERTIYQRYQNNAVGVDHLAQINPVLSIPEIMELRQMISKVTIREELIDYVYQVIQATRNNPWLSLGASPRAGIYLILAAKVNAIFQNRDYVIPDDIQEIVYPVLRHRLLVKPETQMEGKNSDLIIKSILTTLKVPR